MRRDEKQVIEIVVNALDGIAFPQPAKGTIGMQTYVAEMRKAKPLMLQILRALQWGDMDEAQRESKRLEDWLGNRSEVLR
jgi:hypothetical protein